MGVNDFARYNAAFKEWFPIWSKELNKAQLIEVYLFPAMAIISTGFVIRRIFHTKRADYFSVFATMLATIALWFFGAPGLRFGGSFLMLLPCFLLGMFLEILNDKIKMKEFPLIAMTILLIYNSYPILGFLSEYNCNNIIWGSDYEELTCEQEKLGTEIIYIPVSGDRTGYYTFPTTPYRTRLNVIELRGDSLRKGFRVKEEYENSLITNYGQIYKE